jgi:uncharacterized protein YdaT
MSKVKDFLQEIGLSESQINELESAETDVDVIIAEWTQKNRELVKTQNKYFTQEEIDNKFRNFSKKAIKNIARLVGMDITDAQANEIAGKDGFEGYISTAEQHFNQRIAEIQTGSDESLKAKLNDLLTKTTEQARLLDETKDQYETRLKQVESEWAGKLTQKEVDAVLSSAFAKVEWADKSRADVDMYYIRQRLNEQGLQVNPDGSVVAKDGTPALSLSGKSIYKSVLSDNKGENPILDIAFEKNLIKVSNGGGGAPPSGGGGGNPNPEELTGEAAKMAARFEAKLKGGA